ncbi:MAG: T9SS C-terminal target domain-containing protein [Ignavibacteriales bacterium]|nr:MAG: T9SS C-terminal target domain-containing protein [Ignavibacteriales bacterium]
MKMIKSFVALIIVLNANALSQSISIDVHDTFISDTLGSEMVFAVDVTNITDAEQAVYLVRTINNLPEGWTSSLCFDACFAYWIDSVTTTPDFNSAPLQPAESREISVHVVPLENTGTGYIQLKIGALRDTGFFIVDLTAVVNPTSVNDYSYKPGIYSLFQNFPNPFNPSTQITFDLKKREHVVISVYNSIGQEVKILNNAIMYEGRHSINFNAEDLNSGIYFYRINTPGFVSTKKMILIK